MIVDLLKARAEFHEKNAARIKRVPLTVARDAIRAGLYTKVKSFMISIGRRNRKVAQ